MPDHQTTIHELKGIVSAFIAERGWDRYNTPKNIALSISLEAAELLEHYQWSEEPKDKAALEKELADIIIYCLQFAYKNGIDLSEAVKAKMEHNRKKYPAGVNDLGQYLKIKQDYRRGASEQVQEDLVQPDP